MPYAHVVSQTVKGTKVGDGKEVNFRHNQFVKTDLSPMLPSPAVPQKTIIKYNIENSTLHDCSKIKAQKKMSNNSFRSLHDLVILLWIFAPVYSKQVSYDMTRTLKAALHAAELPGPWIGLLAVQKASLVSKHLFSDAFGFRIYRKWLTCCFCTLLAFFLLQIQMLLASIYTKHSQDVCHSLPFT